MRIIVISSEASQGYQSYLYGLNTQDYQHALYVIAHEIRLLGDFVVLEMLHGVSCYINNLLLFIINYDISCNCFKYNQKKLVVSLLFTFW